MFRDHVAAAPAPVAASRALDIKQPQAPLAAIPLAEPVKNPPVFFHSDDKEIIPPEVKIEDLRNGRLLTEIQHNRIQARLKDKPPGRYPKKLFADIGVPYGIIKDEYGNINPIYRYKNCKLTPAEHARVKKILKNSKPGFYPPEYFTHFRFFTPYSIIKNPDGTIEVSSQVVIGQGAFGALKIAQHHITKRWWALKTGHFLGKNGAPVVDKDARHNLFQEELDMLRVANRTDQALLFERISKKTGHKKVDFLMHYESGISFELILNNRRFFSEERILDMTVDLFNEYMDKIFGNKLLHRDIKPSNMMYDLVRNLARIIDLGFAVQCDDSRTYEGKGKKGTPGFIAPELEKYTVYSDKTEVYAWGRVLSRALLDYIVVVVTREPLQCRFKDSSAPATYFRQRSDVVKFIEAMCHEDPAKRPTLQEVHHFLHKLKFIQKLRVLSRNLNNKNDPVVIAINKLIKMLDGRLVSDWWESKVDFNEQDFNVYCENVLVNDMLTKGKSFLPKDFLEKIKMYSDKQHIQNISELQNKLKAIVAALSDQSDPVVIALNKLQKMLSGINIIFLDQDFDVYCNDPLVADLLKKNQQHLPQEFLFQLKTKFVKAELQIILEEFNKKPQSLHSSSPINSQSKQAQIAAKLLEFLNKKDIKLDAADIDVINQNQRLKGFIEKNKVIFAKCLLPGLPPSIVLAA